MMDEVLFRNLLDDHLVPMFAGTKLGQTVASTHSHGLVAYQHPCALLMKPLRREGYRVQLLRSQPFSQEEKRLVKFFVEELASIIGRVDAAHLRDLMDTVPRRVISKLLPGTRGRGTLEQVIQKLEALAAETYEGRPVAVALGMTASMGYGSITLDELWREPFSRVVSNGFDSMYVCGSDGRVFNVVYLSHPKSVAFAPHRLGAIAEWCCKTQRTAVLLNRSGEVLVFKDQKLQFAKRRGSWRHYAHDSVVKRLGFGDPSLRRAVYESCLDVSFARSGGCVAVLAKSGQSKVSTVLDEKDLIEGHQHTRTKLLKSAVKSTFQKLDRRFRQELLSMDGATVLSHKGEVLTAGTIVRVPGGSTGGGRRAAALELSKLGLAIKISADGPIEGFRKKKSIFSL